LYEQDVDMSTGFDLIWVKWNDQVLWARSWTCCLLSM